MTIEALCLGAPGVLADTTDMERRAFNAAFAAAGLDWHWEAETFAKMVSGFGGRAMIDRQGRETGQDVDAETLMSAKTALFQRMMADEGLTLRPGIADLIAAAQNRAIPIAWVTDFGAEEAHAILDNLGDAVHPEVFAFNGAGVLVENAKPAPDIYAAALDDMGVAAANALAIEAVPWAAQAALSAGIETVAFPVATALPDDFPDGARVLSFVSPDLLDDDAARPPARA